MARRSFRNILAVTALVVCSDSAAHLSRRWREKKKSYSWSDKAQKCVEPSSITADNLKKNNQKLQSTMRLRKKMTMASATAFVFSRPACASQWATLSLSAMFNDSILVVGCLNFDNRDLFTTAPLKRSLKHLLQIKIDGF